MVRRAYDRSFNAAMMEDFDDSEVIRASELRDHPDFADWKLLRGGYSRLVQTSAQHSELLESMATAIREVQHSVSQLSKQLGQHPIDAEFSQHVLPTTDEHTEKFDSMEALLRELKQAPSIEMPEFDASNVSDWLSKVEQSFRVRRFSVLDKLDLVAFSLEGYVLQWFSWEMSHNEFRSWDEFRRRLLLKFGAAPEKFSQNVAGILEERVSYTEKKGTVSTSVTESAELSSQVIGLDKSQEVLKLKEPMGLENNKPAVLRMETGSFCQLFSEATSKPWGNQQIFTSKPAASVHSLSFEVGTEETMSSGLSQNRQVWEPGGVLSDHVLVDNVEAGSKGLAYDGCVILGMNCASFGRGQTELLATGQQKNSRCLKASRFNFKRKKKRIKRWFNTLSCRESWRKHKPENLQIVSGLLGFNLVYFRCHKEYGLARMINWKNMPSIAVIAAKFKFKRGLETRIMIQGYLSSTEASVRNDFTSDGIIDGYIAKLLNSTCGKLQSYDYGLEITFLRRLRVHQQQQKRKFIKSWRFKSKSSLRNTRSESREMNQFVGFMKFQLKHKWRSKHLHTISALGFYLSSVFSTGPSATSGRLQGLLEQVLQKDDEAYLQILDKLQLNLKQGMDVHGASGLRLFLCQQKFSSIWHRWRRKDSDLEVQLKERALVQSSMSPRLLDEAVWIPEVGCRELLVKWQDHVASENFWMFSKDFVQLYPSSKLEDKLVFEGGSIDTIKQSYYRKKKPRVETKGFSCKEALERNREFAVSLLEVWEAEINRES